MAVFRVERNKGYTVMSNHHLRNKELSLKAKGLLSQMLSLPEDWDYTLKGLSLINREKIDAIREAIKELERAGYIVRSRERDEKGRLRGADYVIFEQPQPPTPDLPTLENPTLDNPTQEKPTLEKPTLENPTQLNKDIQRTDLPKKEKSNTDLSSTHSIPILSPNPSPCREAATPPERKGTEAAAQSAVDIYREIIKDNIDYHILKQDMKFDGDRLDEIVDLMLETVCTARKRVRIAGDDYPAELVKSKFMKLDGEHIRFVLDCMRENTTKIRNIKQYLKAALFNAPSTIGNYYTSLAELVIRIIDYEISLLLREVRNTAGNKGMSLEETIYHFLDMVVHSRQHHFFVMTQEEEMWVYKHLSPVEFEVYQQGQARFYEQVLALWQIPQEKCSPKELGNLILSVVLIYNSAARSLPFFFPEELEQTAKAQATALSRYLASLADADK